MQSYLCHNLKGIFLARHNGSNAQCVCGVPLVPLKTSRYKGRRRFQMCFRSFRGVSWLIVFCEMQVVIDFAHMIGS